VPWLSVQASNVSMTMRLGPMFFSLPWRAFFGFII
jgi:hypothetical protein